jgi:hypothetical protein
MKILQSSKELSNKICTALGLNKEVISINVYENSSGVYFSLEEFLNQYNPESIQKGQCNLIFRMDIGERCVCTFQLKDMYNCCGIIVASDLFIDPDIRNKYIGTDVTKFIIEFSKWYGYGILQAQDVIDNEYMVRIFQKLGWNKSIEFKNPKTKNNLAIWLLNLN